MAESSGNWAKLKRLNGWQLRVLFLTPFILALTWRRLHSIGYRQTLAKFEPEQKSALSAEEQLSLAKKTAYAVAVAVKYGPWNPLCLLRSLTLGWFLGRKGIPFKVRIGLPDGQSFLTAEGKLDFTAHAWVEAEGVVLNDKENISAEYSAFE